MVRFRVELIDRAIKKSGLKKPDWTRNALLSEATKSL